MLHLCLPAETGSKVKEQNRRFFVGKWGSLSFTNGQGIVNLSIFVGGKLIYYILIDIR